MSRGSRKYLMEEEIEALRRVLERFRHKYVRDCLMFEILLVTGIRQQELLNLRKQDLNPAHQAIFVGALKGGVARELPLSEDLFGRLADYSSKFDPEELIFKIK